MSLKAKIEAVLYASEEPVTLAQLVGLLGEEAQADLNRTAEAQASLQLDNDGTTAADPKAEDPTHPTPPAKLAGTPDRDETARNGAPEVEDGDGTSEDSAVVDVGRAEKARMALLRGHFRAVLEQLVAEYGDAGRGIEIREVAGGFRFATKPEYHDAVRGFVKGLKPPLKLTLQALETLAVVAYKQPVTAPEISEIRGVDSSGVLGSLMARKLITTAGRKQVIGRPMLYRTTKEFLVKFGLKDVGELPSIEEFEKMAEQLAEQEEIPMGDDESARERRADDEERPEIEADESIVDGRMSGLPPAYDDVADDPSAAEAEVQQREDGSHE